MNSKKGNSKDIKVVLLGDSGVGKSSILLRFVTNEFKEGVDPTLGAAFMSQSLKHGDVDYKFQIWDTAGQEKYKSLAPLYYRDAQVAVVVYDICNRGSFDVVKQWITELKEHGPGNMMGNKQDLIEKEQVKHDEATQYARVLLDLQIQKQLGAIFKYTSAKEGKGINELFENIVDNLTQREQQLKEEMINPIKIGNTKKKESGTGKKCC